jgi:hypothetical protein
MSLPEEPLMPISKPNLILTTEQKLDLILSKLELLEEQIKLLQRNSQTMGLGPRPFPGGYNPFPDLNDRPRFGPITANLSLK